MDEKIILTELRAGRLDGVRALYAGYGPEVFSLAFRRTGDAALAREVLRDVMVRVWRSAPRFDVRRRSLREWVLQLAMDTTGDVARRAPARRRPLAELAEAEVDLSDDVDAILHESLVRMAIERLPTDHRQIVETVYFRRRTVTEAAAELGIPEATVRSRCFYALKNLRISSHELGVMTGVL